MHMILNHSLHDILKPFQGVLDSLASRQAAKKQALYKSGDPGRGVPNIRRKTSQDFDMWDRLREALQTNQSEQTAEAPVAPAAAPAVNYSAAKAVDTAPSPLPLEKIRANLGRTKKTTTKMRVIEGYLHPPEYNALDWTVTQEIKNP